MSEERESTALTRAEQAAWEAPALRPAFTPGGHVEEWAHPCPEWCTGQGPGHDVERITEGRRRQHQGTPLRVRMDTLSGFDGYDENNDEEGVWAGHLDVSLVSPSRAPQNSTIQIVTRYSCRDGEGGYRPTSFSSGTLYPDEARELIAVLQHLLRVAGA